MSGANEAAAAAADDGGTPAGNGGDASEVETLAREQGWRPKEEFTGKGNWIDAQEFLDRGSAPKLRQRLKQLETDSASKIGDLEKRLKEVSDVLGEFAEHSRTAEERAYQRARKEIIEEMRGAVETGDAEAFDKHQAELDELDKHKPKPASEKKTPTADDSGSGQDTQPKVEISAVAKRWIDDPANSWFHSNGRMNAYATAAHGENMRNGMSEGESLKAVSEEVRKIFPSHFENQARRAPGSVNAPSGDGLTRPRKREKTYDDLPAEAKAACDRFVKSIKGYTREQYVKEYDWSSADGEA